MGRRACLLALAAVCACAPPPNPTISGNHITLLIEGENGVTPGVTGDFTAWKPEPARALGRGRWFQFDTAVETDARVEYLIAYGPADFRVDPRNPHRVPSVGGEASEVTMPDAEQHPELAIDNRPLDGSIEERRFPAANGATRRVVVYRPAQKGSALPVVYFHDGSLMVDAGRVPAILDRLIASGRLVPLVAVFVDPLSRADDYKAEPEFREWFVGELMPAIERDLAAPPPSRAVIGVSRGAIAAIDLAWQYPERFSACGLLIPSVFPTDLIATVARSPAKPIRFAIIAGRYDVRWLSEGRALHDALDSKGYALTYREVPEGHNVQTWRAHLDDVLSGLGFGTR